MAIRSVRFPLLALAVLALALGGCKRAEESAPSAPAPATPPVSSAGVFRVVSVDVGDAIDGGKRIPAPVAQFAPSDTVYASVATEGAAPRVTIVARWTYEDGQLVNESTQVIAPTGPAATEFHIAKPSGLPSGKYKVEVTADGKLAGSREFEVK
jgi:hypothetical protein